MSLISILLHQIRHGEQKIATKQPTQNTQTEMYIDDTDVNGTDIQTYLRTIDDSTSTIKVQC